MLRRHTVYLFYAIHLVKLIGISILIQSNLCWTLQSCISLLFSLLLGLYTFYARLGKSRAYRISSQTIAYSLIGIMKRDLCNSWQGRFLFSSCCILSVWHLVLGRCYRVWLVKVRHRELDASEFLFQSVNMLHARVLLLTK